MDCRTLAKCVLIFSMAFAGCSAVQHSTEERRPNILLIVADDLGYSDIGAYGGEIETPTIDALARDGVLLTNFHTSPTCSPTRAMLLTGVDNHIAGLGNMKELSTAEERRQPGYEGYLNHDVVTVATRLQDAGYRSYLSGKWHLGDRPGLLPRDRGFDRSFALLQGAGNHFDRRGYSDRVPLVDYVAEGESVQLADDFYSTVTFTDRMIEFIASGQPADPFFAYLAYSAPHWPLQAPADTVERYKSVYANGWDRIRAARFERMKTLQILRRDAELRPRRSGVAAWDDLDDETRDRESTTMAIYAAMITLMDAQVGRILEFLESRGQLDNTIVIFMSDNGAEGRDLVGFPHFRSFIEANFPDDAVPGSADSFIFPGPAWGQVSATPHRYSKKSTAEGGLRSPLIIRAPQGIEPGISRGFIQVTDIAATVLDIAGIDQARERYRAFATPTGRSVLPYLYGHTDVVYSANEAVGFELNGHAALYRGPWKAVRMAPPFGDSSWSLYNIETDQAELHDLAETEPEVLQSLLAAFEQYASDVGVIQR